jgi:uncharacterized repeat protein (TIGR03803 family)
MRIIRLAGLALIGALSTTIHAQSYKVLVNFNGEPSNPEWSGIIAQSRGGNLLSCAPDLATDSRGVAFKVATSGALTVLHEFGTGYGAWPVGGLTLSRNGRFYGTNTRGGTYNSGSIFEMTPDGIVKTLHEFMGGSEGGPQAPPIQSLYGDFYGTTSGEDLAHPGTVYKIDSSGTYTLLHTFIGPDGSTPMGPLVQATDYWFYGTTLYGGIYDAGTIFRISQSGEFETLFNFDGLNGSNGAYPEAGLIQASDGNLYGVAPLGGAHGQGVIFRMTPKHEVTIIHAFTGGSDGSTPIGNIVQAADGYLYGTNSSGGASGGGVLFRSTTTGTVTALHDFDPSTGSTPVALIQHTNGFLYGDTNKGGSSGQGVFYRYDIGQPPFVTYLPSYGRVGMTVQILGQYFTANSEVFFNGTSAQITEVEPTYMKAVVPDGATSGYITVTTARGTLKSDKTFVVRP